MRFRPRIREHRLKCRSKVDRKTRAEEENAANQEVESLGRNRRSGAPEYGSICPALAVRNSIKGRLCFWTGLAEVRMEFEPKAEN